MKSVNKALSDVEDTCSTGRKIWIITDSQSTITTLSTGPGNQYSVPGNNTWRTLLQLADRKDIAAINFQWVPGHKGIAGNEEADKLAAEAAKLPQDEVPIDFTSAKAAVRRRLRKEDLEEVAKTGSFHHRCTGSRPKPLPTHLTRREQVIIHQLRAGKSSLVAHCLYRYRGLSEEKGLCMAGCGVKETVEHLLTCPMYERQRQESDIEEGKVLQALNDEPEKVLKFLDKIGRRTIPAQL